MQALTYDAMRTDLAATFPGLWMRPLCEFGGQWKDAEGIWTGAEDEVLMPDGLPIFETVDPDFDEYDGTVHRGFIAWLESRNWGYERYDESTYFLVPLSHFHAPSVSDLDGNKYSVWMENADRGEPCIRVSTDDSSIDVSVAWLVDPFHQPAEHLFAWPNGYIGRIPSQALIPFARKVAAGLMGMRPRKGRFELQWVPESGEPAPWE
ncbi:Uncharacterised protein [Achromobacter xylosoxidans]|jgi:hypothetical protein|uniref:hypothetical protein n=1 Tax=Achromobacter TaxID=222 RepID=UPI0006C3FD89|nr:MULTISPECIES: hypothetical protein [Achromobacter]CAB3855191.1 hypothetical protein LMG26846_02197 [Achromobacter insuavis]CUK13096.1 Uncharacterised protein [Achromobacter xylosoxidans]